MGKTRKLNGLPGNLANSYLSTLGYYDGGYMADWINHIAREKSFNTITVNILCKSVEPKEAEIIPLLADLDKLQSIINQELKSNGFDNSFLKSAILKFEIPINSESTNDVVYCNPILEDINGKEYRSQNQIVETAYKVDLNSLEKHIPKS